ncbi:MAG: hypothetical protein AABX86_02485 [Nanoarchaeota archaeon]
MKIFVCCSKHFYHKLEPRLSSLSNAGFEITLPNSYYTPMKEEEMKLQGPQQHAQWKGDMLRLQIEKVAANDVVLVVNYDKKINLTMSAELRF